MRVFVAVPLAPTLREELGVWAGRAQGELSDARWVKRENLHITLWFLGEISAPAVVSVQRELDVALGGVSRFSLLTAGTGTFPPRRPARVAWVGFADSASMVRLHCLVTGAVQSALPRMAAEKRPYHPHVTMARLRRPWVREVADRFVRLGTELAGRVVPVDRVVLMGSRLAPGGAQYSELATYELVDD